MAHNNFWGINAKIMVRPILLIQFFVIFLLASFSLNAANFEEGKQAFIDQDYEKALSILQPLAVQGNPDAQVTLGLMYESGKGVEKNTQTAFEWYEAAAEQGVANIQHDLGVKYFNGDGVEQDYSKAIEWWEKAEAIGYADSQFNLGLMYYRGIGTPQNFVKAKTLFEKASAQNHGNAQYSLGVMHAFGQGVPQSYKQALELFFKAAALDVAQAQFNLGVFYENGYGVKADAKEANKWYTMAANQGLAEAAEKVGSVTIAKEEQTPEVTEIKPEPGPAASITEEEPEVIVQAETVTTDTELPSSQDRTEWLRSQPSEHYTIQIASFLTKDEVINYINKNNYDSNAGYVQVFVKNENRLSLLYGYYTSYSKAQRASADLANRHNIKPWVRNIGKLKETLR